MTEQTGRSRRLTAEQQTNANTALSRFGTKADLAASLAMSRTTINKFFKGESVQVKNFQEICKKLRFDWQPEPATPPQSATEHADIDELVREVRDLIRPIIQERCGTMRVLDMSQPIALGEIYTHVNILEKVTGRTRRELAELVQDIAPENFERFSLGAVTEKRVPGLEAVEKHTKLMIPGKPGAGKTTFLKHLAIQCIDGAFQSDHVPLFITLKDFAETDGQPDLMTFIDQAIATSLPSHNTQQLLDDGRALILLDGLDEVRETDASRVLRQIQQFSERYSRNTFVITCRIAAREYTFQQFTEVEVADFDDAQIADFSDKWFRSRKKSVRTEDFLQKLNEKPPIRKLATSPLLLSLLCLIFEDSGDFPAKRSSIYEHGIEQLLREWNPHERERCPFYKELSPDHRQSLLRYIAANTFEKGNYFFKQQEAGKLIKEYIKSLSCFTPRELLKLDIKVTLKTIEAQHGLLIERANGVYSFSHLTFHEYFAALEITENPNLESLQRLATHITETRWREVFLLTAEMLQLADDFLWQMKQEIDELLAGDEKLQALLKWVDEKPQSINCSYEPTAIRAFYFASAGIFNSNRIRPSIDIRLLKKLDKNIELLSESREFYINDDLILDSALCVLCGSLIKGSFNIVSENSSYSVRESVSVIESILTYSSNVEIRRILQQLKNELPDNVKQRVPIGYKGGSFIYSGDEFPEEWLSKNGKPWTKRLRIVMVEQCDIGHDRQFGDIQNQLLWLYHDANKLLVECLNSASSISQDVRQEIEETLLLPITEIEKRRKNE